MLGRRGTSIGIESPYRFRGVPASPAWCTTQEAWPSLIPRSRY